VTEGDAQMPHPHRAGGLHVLHLPDRQHARADHPRGARDDGDGDGDDHVLDGGAERRRHHHGEDEEGQALQDVEHPLGDEIGLAADVAGQKSDDAAKE
jgi:hypothetical protein